MSSNAGALVQALIDGGVQPAAARVIANALANASTPQFSQSRDLSDQTPSKALRMIDTDARKYQFTNLDYSREDPYERRLRTAPGQYAANAADHPYKDAQPVVPVPPLSKESIQGGQYIGVENTVRDGAPLATVNLKLNSRAGTHLRLNPATNSVDAVPLSFRSPQGLVTGDVTEGSAATEIELAVRNLQPVEAVQADGTSRGVLAWTDPTVTPATVFTPWIKQNIFSKTSGAEVLAAIGGASAANAATATPWVQQNVLNKNSGAEVLSAIGGFPASEYATGFWAPTFQTIGAGAEQPIVNYDASLRVGLWTRVGELVYVTGRVAITQTLNIPVGSIVISGLPFLVRAGQAGHTGGSVGFKTGWNNQGPDVIYTQPATNYLVLAHHTATSVGFLPGFSLLGPMAADLIFSCLYRI